MTLIDRVVADPGADARIRTVASALDGVVTRLADRAGAPGLAGDQDRDRDRHRDLDDLRAIDRVVRLILDAGIARAHEERETSRALPVRRTAWVRAHQDQLVVAALADEADADADADGARVAPDEPLDQRWARAWQRHLAVVERAEHGLRQIKTAIGDSAVAPDPELAGHEHDLRVLARLVPATPGVWDRLFATIAATRSADRP